MWKIHSTSQYYTAKYILYFHCHDLFDYEIFVSNGEYLIIFHYIRWNQLDNDVADKIMNYNHLIPCFVALTMHVRNFPGDEIRGMHDIRLGMFHQICEYEDL